MTGSNKYVLSIYSKMLGQKLEQSKLDVILSNFQKELRAQDIRQLSNIGVPVGYLKLKSKQQVLDHILKEVIEFIPVAKTANLRQFQKATNKLGKAIQNQLNL